MTLVFTRQGIIFRLEKALKRRCLFYDFEMAVFKITGYALVRKRLKTKPVRKRVTQNTVAKDGTL